MIEVREFIDALAVQRANSDTPARAAALDRLRWAIEEFRVQQFAQELKTREAVSDKRLRKMLDALQGGA